MLTDCITKVKVERVGQRLWHPKPKWLLYGTHKLLIIETKVEYCMMKMEAKVWVDETTVGENETMENGTVVDRQEYTNKNLPLQ